MISSVSWKCQGTVTPGLMTFSWMSDFVPSSLLAMKLRTLAFGPLGTLPSTPRRISMCIPPMSDRLLLGRPRLIVAGGLGAAAACQDRAGRAVGHRRPRQVGNMRLFPGLRLVCLFDRRNVDGVMQPAMP